MEWLILVLQVTILVALGGLTLLARNYLPSYVNEKGKNLATREDIHEITRQIESAKLEYAKELEGLKFRMSTKFQVLTSRHIRLMELKRMVGEMHCEGDPMKLILNNTKEEALNLLRGLETSSHELESLMLKHGHLFSPEISAEIKQKVNERSMYEIKFIQDIQGIDKNLSPEEQHKIIFPAWAAKCKYHDDSIRLLVTFIDDELERINQDIESLT